MISIIIPHYNSWSKLSELLNTIPRDSRLETIVIDDKSDDVERLVDFKLSFPNVVFLENNSTVKGAGAARNIGLNYATGEWLVFADADDLFSPYFLKMLTSYIDKEYDIVYFKPSSFHDDKNLETNRHGQYEKMVVDFLKEPNTIHELRLRYEFLVPWSKLIRKEIVDRHRIMFEEIMQANDILFSAKVGFHAKEITADIGTIYSVRESEGSLTSKMTEQSLRNRFNAWLDYVAFLKRHLTSSEFRILNISSMSLLSKVYKNKLRFSNYFYIIKNSFKNRIPLFDNRVFNPKLMSKLLVSKIQNR